MPIALMFGFGCTQWPRHEYLPAAPEALATGEDPGSSVEVFWTFIEESGEGNDTPTGDDVAVLDTGRGFVFRGRLDSAGWDGAAAATALESDTGCADTSVLPPTGVVGNYTGDVDWVTLRTTSGATLCGRLELAARGARADLLAYRLDECAQPLQVGDTGAWIGMNTGGNTVSWSTMSAADTRFGVVVGGLDSNNSEDVAVQNYVLTVALIAASTDGAPGLCPVPDLEALVP
jgi:hypothetical protein